MITIIVDTKGEYKTMMEYARQHVCKHTPSHMCSKTSCDECFEENHKLIGIRIFGGQNNDRN